MCKYKVVIVDDDKLSCETLGFSLEKDGRFSVEGVAHNGAQGKKLIAKAQPDLIFLDVEMPDMTGMQLLQEMRDSFTWPVRVVFYTAYDKYMIHAIREAAFDYHREPGQPGKTFIVFTPTNDMRALHISEIGFFRYCSDKKQWEVVLDAQPPLPLRRGMTAEQIIQCSPNFVQIHQSYIINIDYLMIIKESKCLLYPPFDKVTELMVSRKYKKELQDRFCL